MITESNEGYVYAYSLEVSIGKSFCVYMPTCVYLFSQFYLLMEKDLSTLMLRSHCASIIHVGFIDIIFIFCVYDK